MDEKRELLTELGWREKKQIPKLFVKCHWAAEGLEISYYAEEINRDNMFQVVFWDTGRKMQAVDLICFRCKNFRRFEGGCLAFPGGIPDQITSGQNEHSKPLKGQRNKIVFEPIREGDEELVNSLI